MQGVVFRPPRYGADSELFAGLSPAITSAHTGRFAIPWGRLGNLPKHTSDAFTPNEEGGGSASKQFFDWCVEETAPFYTETQMEPGTCIILYNMTQLGFRLNTRG